MITHVGIVTVHIYDQDEALDFYTNKLGFETVMDADLGEGVRWIIVKPPQGDTAVTLYKLPGHEPGQFPIGSHHPIVFNVDDMDATYRELTARGVEFSQEPAEVAPGMKNAMFFDADRNELMLTETTGE